MRKWVSDDISMLSTFDKHLKKEIQQRLQRSCDCGMLDKISCLSFTPWSWHEQGWAKQ